MTSLRLSSIYLKVAELDQEFNHFKITTLDDHTKSHLGSRLSQSELPNRRKCLDLVCAGVEFRQFKPYFKRLSPGLPSRPRFLSKRILRLSQLLLMLDMPSKVEARIPRLVIFPI